MAALSILLFVVILIYAMLPFICFYQIAQLKKRINDLSLKRVGSVDKISLESPKIIKSKKSKVELDIPDFDFIPPSKAKATTAKTITQKNDPEQNFSTNLFVWIGGIALALAGIYLVKYSIENNLVSPQLRVIFGLIFGTALLMAGRFISGKSIANSEKISQALIGAAIIDFYGCFYAASNLYQLITITIGFIGMAATTLLAIVLSVRHGPPIAVLGLIGGFITPSLFGSEHPQASVLFMYLFFLVIGLFSVASYMCWWLLAVFVTMFAYLWVGVWLCTSFVEADTLWLSLFIIGLCAVAFSSSKIGIKRSGELATGSIAAAVSTIVIGIFMLSWVLKTGGMQMADWIYYGWLSVFAFGFAYFEQGKYLYAPWIAMAVNALMLITWQADAAEMFYVILIFNILFSGIAYFAMLSRAKPATWALLGAVTNVLYYFISYWQTNALFPGAELKMFWGLYAFVFAIVALASLQLIISKKKFFDGKTYKMLISVFAVLCVTFISTGLFMEVDQKFFHLVLAMEILIISWINSRPMHLEALRYTVGILLGLIAFSLIDDIYRICGNFSSYQLLGELSDAYRLNFISNPYLHYGVQTLALVFSAHFLLKEKDSQVVKWVEGFAIISLMFLGTFAISNFFAPPTASVQSLTIDMSERGILNIFYLLVGLGVLRLGQSASRANWGVFIVSYAIFRIASLDLLHYNPLFEAEYVGVIPLFNNLLLAYGLPMLVIYFAANNTKLNDYSKFRKTCSMFLFVMLLFYVSLNVRQFFQGAYLNLGTTSNLEMYAYSVAWLVLGFVLAFMGTLYQDRSTRVASAVVMFLTVGKVFLIDAQQLEGLLRVFSFFGLGISLLGLSYFYSRFVFQKK